MGLAVVKVGGSLASRPKSLRSLLQMLNKLSRKGKIIVVPGGGEFADTVRQMDARFELSNNASHRMAVLAMDQYGLLLADLLPSSSLIYDIEKAKSVLECGGVPIFLPSKLIFSRDPLENSWDVTSDSIALYIAANVNARILVLITDVDGIYTSDPKIDKTARLIEQLTPEKLLSMGRTSVDKAVPGLLEQYKIDCYVLNGFFPKRLAAVLEGQKTLFTLISSR